MKNKKILIIGSIEKFSLEKMYERAFKSIGSKVEIIHAYDIKKNLLNKFIWKYLRFIIFIFIKNKIITKIKKINSIDLIIIFKGIYINNDFILNIKKFSPNTKIINIFPDDPFDVDYFKDISNKNVLKSINSFDNIFIYSKKILKKLKKKFNKQMFHYLPFGNDNYIHKKINNYLPTFDLSFVGTADHQRYDVLTKLKEFKIILAGNGWEKFKIPKNVKFIKDVGPKDYAKTICKSKISLNILRAQNKFSHNMKTFEIPSMGGLMITERTKEQQLFFPENKACLMYGNLSELKKKIKSSLKNIKKFDKIKNNGFKLSKNYTYKKRAIFILKKVFQND